MNQTTIDLAAYLLSGEYIQEDTPSGTKMNKIYFPYVANELLDYFYDCNQDGATDYETLQERCKLMVKALDDVIKVYKSSERQANGR
jgi:hypothetical protein